MRLDSEETLYKLINSPQILNVKKKKEEQIRKVKDFSSF